MYTIVVIIHPKSIIISGDSLSSPWAKNNIMNGDEELLEQKQKSTDYIHDDDRNPTTGNVDSYSYLIYMEK